MKADTQFHVEHDVTFWRKGTVGKGLGNELALHRRCTPQKSIGSLRCGCSGVVPVTSDHVCKGYQRKPGHDEVNL